MSLYKQRNSLWTTTCIFVRDSENGGKIFGKDLDCYPDCEISSRITTGKLGIGGFERKWRRETWRERGIKEILIHPSPGHDLSFNHVYVSREVIWHKGKNTNILANSSILLGLALEMSPLQSWLPTRRLELRHQVRTHIFSNGMMWRSG